MAVDRLLQDGVVRDGVQTGLRTFTLSKGAILLFYAQIADAEIGLDDLDVWILFQVVHVLEWNADRQVDAPRLLSSSFSVLRVRDQLDQ